uniref:Early heading date 2 n=1 Tax=Oryza sativa subsp. japonica TaxID=39947 RepID=B1B536_ORYSJ|nr:early heading date 2 [Oryza sativa Japonica Group]BAG12105.1 early heading date 2 [Oryza sativa Japonica Group]
MLLSDLSSDQEATGSNSHGGGGGDRMVVGSHGAAHVVLSNLFLPPAAAAAATMLLPAAPVMVRPAAMAAAQEPRAKKKRSLPGNPDPEAEVIALSPRALVATNRFVCEVCNKGFQRDQNLQLHRRGHNLPWKLRHRAAAVSAVTTAAPAPRKRVYVCPEPTCVRAPRPGSGAGRPDRDQEALLAEARGEAVAVRAVREEVRRALRLEGARQELRHPRVPLRLRHPLLQEGQPADTQGLLRCPS